MHQNLDKATDALGRMIAAARADLARGRAVDLGNIENVATALYRSVSAMRVRQSTEPAIVTRLEALLNDLGALESDLTRRQQLLLGA
jgi:hypothetical protein